MATDIVKITDLPEKADDFNDGDLILVSEYVGGVFTSKKKNAYNIRQVPSGHTIYDAKSVNDSYGTAINIPAGLNLPIRGSNARGYYELWPDGTMKCWFSIDIVGAISSASGSIYITGLIALGQWPVVFNSIVDYKLSIKATAGANRAWIFDSRDVSVSSGGQTRLAAPTSMASDTYTISVSGIGRWKT